MSPLLRFLLPAFLLGLALPALADSPKFATVNAARAFEAYYKTVDAKAEIAEARAKLKQDPRFEVIKLTRVELLDLRNKVRDPGLSEEAREKHFQQFQMKAYELRSLQKDALQHTEKESKLVDEKMVEKTKALLEAVHASVRKIAEKGGYEYVFEMSGNTSSQIPTLLYIRDAVDITDLVIEDLNKDKPADKKVATAND